VTTPVKEKFEINSLTAAGNFYTAPSYPVGGTEPRAANATIAAAAPIIRATQTTIVLVTSISVTGTGFSNDGTNINLGGIITSGISLPADAIIGDIVEVYVTALAAGATAAAIFVWAPVGSNLNGNLNGYLSASGPAQSTGGTAFRKIDALNWCAI
jgi:hypothetical protein